MRVRAELNLVSRHPRKRRAARGRPRLTTTIPMRDPGDLGSRMIRRARRAGLLADVGGIPYSAAVMMKDRMRMPPVAANIKNGAFMIFPQLF